MMLQGKKALVVGVASNRSIAYGIAQALHEQGAELALTYQAEKLKPRVEKFAAAWDSTLVFPCDLTSDSEIEAVFSALAETWDGIDIIIHSAAFAPMEELDGDYVWRYVPNERIDFLKIEKIIFDHTPLNNSTRIKNNSNRIEEIQNGK